VTSPVPGAEPRRVVVTGVGLVTPLGASAAATWEGLVAGRSGIRRIERFDPSRLESQMAGECRDFDPAEVVDRKELRRTDRFVQLGLGASREALGQAGFQGRLDPELGERAGAIVGSGLGGMESMDAQHAILDERGPDRISPFLIPQMIVNIAAGRIAIDAGLMGPSFAPVSACATGGHAIGESFETIRRGDADLMVAGGSESVITELIVGGFAALKGLSRRNDEPERASRPFDAGRDGFVIAEGAGILVLEELSHAQARGATILAELAGYGATADASHITLPAPGGNGALRAARRAIEKAGLTPDAIDHVNMHATSTGEGDRAELQAMRTLLGARSGDVAMTAIKSMIGHTLGAAGAIAAASAVLTLRDGVIPPTINLEEPDAEAEGLDLTPLRARTREVRTVLVNSFGFGGQNAALVFRRWTA
jgi:3-oxoacyl-[acyl-carrier-protein] synthase II